MSSLPAARLPTIKAVKSGKDWKKRKSPWEIVDGDSEEVELEVSPGQFVSVATSDLDDENRKTVRGSKMFYITSLYEKASFAAPVALGYWVYKKWDFEGVKGQEAYTENIGDGELVPSNEMDIISVQSIDDSPTHRPYFFDEQDPAGRKVAYDRHYARLFWDYRKGALHGIKFKTSTFDAPRRGPLPATCCGRLYCVNNQRQIYCKRCQAWRCLKSTCVTKLGSVKEGDYDDKGEDEEQQGVGQVDVVPRWSDEPGALDANLLRAPFIRGKWYTGAQRDDWMLAGSGTFLARFQEVNRDIIMADGDLEEGREGIVVGEDARRRFGLEKASEVVKRLGELKIGWYECKTCDARI
ncbi:hypothetical protein D9611_010957 [Ephemerocybe angulata]|uniref:Uncharacterized protein n=1 Tax=Ephemerocybe angulata TaxID=980116 RepID=A0A8H5C5X6_9AGAR|nr:hypothetical protein D9611_010957 [Tulosesus angulatus]